MLPVAESSGRASGSAANPLPIAVFGFDQKALKSLEVAFKNYGENCATIVDEKHAEAAIFDFDVLESRRAMIRFRTNFPNIPTVIVCSKSVPLKDGYLLQKPLRVGKFVKIFQEIRANRAATANAPNAIDAALFRPQAPVARAPQPAQKVSHSGDYNEAVGVYDPKEYLQGIIQSAAEEAKAHGYVPEIIVKVDDNLYSIKVLPGLGKISCELKNAQLKYLCSSPLYCLETKVVKHKGEAGKKLEAVHLYDKDLISVESFIWSIALWTSESRIPAGLNLHSSYQLRRWPNFTRLRTLPNALPMTAMLIDKPMNLKLFQKVVNLPAAEVFTFLSCVNAIGLLMEANAGTESPNAGVVAEQSHPTRNLFRKLVSKLRIK